MTKPYNVLILGGIIIDRYIVVDQYPTPGQDTFIKEEFDRVGGSAINVAFTLQNLQCRPCLVSAIGPDENGSKILNYLKENDLDSPSIHEVPYGKTGYCYTVLDETGERTFFSRKGSESTFLPTMVNEQLKKIAYAYVTGYYLLDNSSGHEILKTLSELYSRGCTILFDPGPLVGHIDKNILLKILSMSKIITPNKDEVDKICSKLGVKVQFSQWCIDLGIELVIIKKGSQGTELYMKTGEVQLPAYDMRTIDTSGAGDSFAGGIIAGLINNYGYEDCVKIASACGAITTTYKGPHGNFSWNDILEIVEGSNSLQK